ncbi:MAG: glycosyl hydrolase 53 family protein [Sediminibacterium sp.]|nr:glycosyl hydrolase 53 family protein [Sediminibacterium sp.]
MHTKWLFIIIVVLSFAGCKKGNATVVDPPIADTGFFAKGADIGWLSEMEAAGIQFYHPNGTATECIQLLKSFGINSIRLRVWVDPSNGWCGTEDVVKQAKRAVNAGMKIMIDFHYSDFWADPGKQNKPKAWQNFTTNELNDAVYTHTKNVMLALKANGVNPKWVQIGNETNDGMLWEEGRASKNMIQFASMLKAGIKAVKEVSNTSKTIIHLSNGYDNPMFRWMFDGLTSNGVEWDVIAMSLYPTKDNWIQLNNQCLVNMQDMISRYGKEIMISEVGMEVAESMACKQFLTDIISKTKSLTNHKGLGVFYWEPQSYNKWKGYTLGAFDQNGKPTIAMEAFMQ